MAVVEFRAGPPDDVAFSAFYRMHYRMVEGFVRHAYPGVDAEDVTATVFATAWRRFEAIPAAASKAWLFGVVRNTVNNHRRARRRAEMLIDRAVLNRPATSVTLTDERVSIETVDQLVAGFNRLREEDREILLFAAWGGLDAGELATTLDISKNAATVRLHRARERLRQATGWHGHDEGASHDGVA